MSIQALSWVLDASRSEQSDRLVAISVANHAGKHGENACQAVATIGAEAGNMSRSTVIRSLRNLEALGELLVFPRCGIGTRADRRTSRYELPLVPGWSPPVGIGRPRTDPKGYLDGVSDCDVVEGDDVSDGVSHDVSDDVSMVTPEPERTTGTVEEPRGAPPEMPDQAAAARATRKSMSHRKRRTDAR